MADIAEKLTGYYSAIKAEETASKNVMGALDALKEAAGSSTFVHEGQHYQIRKRKDKTYLCELAGPPKGRPKKDRALVATIDSPVVNEV
jgi:hypothetical protein